MPVISAIVTACDRVAPLWPLTHFVAVNPFVGMSELPFEDAVALVERTSHAQMLPGRSATTRARSVADLVDELTPRAMNGHAFVVDEISKWCSSYFDQGQAVWPMPWRGQSLWSAWKAAASVDANAELMGIAGFRARVACLSDDPVEVITVALAELRVPVEAFDTYLLRLLMSTPGWSGYVQYRVRARQMAGTVSDELTQLLAIRITYDVALHAGTPSIQPAWDDARAQLASSGGGELTQITSRGTEIYPTMCDFEKRDVDRYRVEIDSMGPLANEGFNYVRVQTAIMAAQSQIVARGWMISETMLNRTFIDGEGDKLGKEVAGVSRPYAMNLGTDYSHA